MFNRWKAYPKHIPKKRGWYICSIRYGEEDGYQDLDELLDDMEYETLNYRKIVC